MKFAIISRGFSKCFKEKIEYCTDIELYGRDFVYPEAIEEFFDKSKSIEFVIINILFYLENSDMVKDFAKVYKTKNFKILYDKTEKKEELIKKEIYSKQENNIDFIFAEEFINEQENLYNLRLKKEEIQMDELGNTLEVDQDISNEISLQENQINFLQSNLGKTINIGLDLGLRAILPNVIEDGIIDIKNAILENGFKEGVNTAINSLVDIGKSALGIITGNFENISQVRTAIKDGGTIDTISSLIDTSIKFAKNAGAIDSSTAKMIKYGKNTILDTISSKLEEELTSQLKYIEKIQNYSNKWKSAYENRDFSEMEKHYKNLNNYMQKAMPLESTLKRARTIENLHNLIKNNGKNFDISDNEKLLAEKLSK